MKCEFFFRRALEEQFEKDDRFTPFCEPGRILIRSGPMLKSFSKNSKNIGKGKTYHFFLFNDLLVYAEVLKKFMGKSDKPRYRYPLLCVFPSFNTPGQNANIQSYIFILHSPQE